METRGRGPGSWFTRCCRSPSSWPSTSSWWWQGLALCPVGSLQSGRTPRCLQPGLVALSGYMFYEFMATSLLANYSYLCQPVDYSRSKLGMRVFFILRKKPEQITFLHVYHHGTMLFNWWAGVKYVPGDQAFFVGMLSSLVHIFMHLYRGLASLGPCLWPLRGGSCTLLSCSW